MGPVGSPSVPAVQAIGWLSQAQLLVVPEDQRTPVVTLWERLWHFPGNCGLSPRGGTQLKASHPA